MDDDYVEIALEVVRPTEGAFLLTDGDTERWIPTSLILPEPSMRWHDYDIGETYKFEIQRWKLEIVGFI